MSSIKNLVLIFLVIFLSSSLIRNILDYRKKMDFYNQFKEDVAAEQKRQLGLKTQILKKTDKTELEKTIRNKLNLAQKDEVVVILPQPTAVPTPIKSAPLPNWQAWWQIFFKK